jgi:hypothetical protein
MLIPHKQMRRDARTWHPTTASLASNRCVVLTLSRQAQPAGSMAGCWAPSCACVMPSDCTRHRFHCTQRDFGACDTPFMLTGNYCAQTCRHVYIVNTLHMLPAAVMCRQIWHLTQIFQNMRKKLALSSSCHV